MGAFQSPAADICLFETAKLTSIDACLNILVFEATSSTNRDLYATLSLATADDDENGRFGFVRIEKMSLFLTVT
jgi:hypothetical protein